MPSEMQSKLLRVLQAGEIKPVGDAVTRKIRVRVIAATNRDLERALEGGGAPLRPLLPLQHLHHSAAAPAGRAEDIPVLAYHFLRKAEAKVNKKVDRFSPEALDLLTRYPWPGNLRELENVIERSVVLASTREVGLPTSRSTFRRAGPFGCPPMTDSSKPRSARSPASSARRSRDFLPRPGKYLPGRQAGAHHPSEFPSAPRQTRH